MPKTEAGLCRSVRQSYLFLHKGYEQIEELMEKMSMATISAKNKLNKLPKFNKCGVCGSWRSYYNSLAKCHECKGRFCYDHINGGQVNDSMKENEKAREVCDECRKKKNYRDL